MGLLVVMGLVVVAAGLFQLLFPGAMWRWHAWGKRFEGVHTERTPEWDTGRGCSGVLLVLFGLGLLAYGCSRLDEPERRAPSRPGGIFPGDLPPHVQARIERQIRERTLQGNEETAIAALRNVVSAEAMFQQACLVDADADGTGEHGGLLEMAGRWKGRGRVPLAIPEFPPFAFGRASGAAVLAGYRFRLYLPDAAGAGVPEPATGFTTEGVDADLCERAWCCYAWPVEYGASGTRTFFTNQEGEVLATDAPAYGGSDEGPIADAAFRGPGIVGPGPDRGPSAVPVPRASGHTAVDATGRDGNTWSRVD